MAGRRSILLSLRLYRGVWPTVKFHLAREFGALDRGDCEHVSRRAPFSRGLGCYYAICPDVELNHGFSSTARYILDGVAVCCIATAEHDVDQTKSITSLVRSCKKLIPKRAEGKRSDDDTIGPRPRGLAFRDVTRADPIRQQLRRRRMVARGQVTNLWPLRPLTDLTSSSLYQTLFPQV